MTKRALKRLVREGEFDATQFDEAKVRRLPVERGWSPLRSGDVSREHHGRDHHGRDHGGPDHGRDQGYLKTIKAKSLGQARLMEAIDKQNLVMALGPAGTGKTYLAIAKAVEALEAGRVGRIVLSRPAVEAGDSAGTRHGESDEIGRSRDEGAVFIEQLDFHVRDVVEGNADGRVVREKCDFHRLARGAQDVGGDFLAIGAGDGLEDSGLIGDLPVERGTVLAGGFLTEGLLVEEELDLTFAFTVTDGDGDTSTGSLTVSVDDDTPIGNTVTAATVLDDEAQSEFAANTSNGSDDVTSNVNTATSPAAKMSSARMLEVTRTTMVLSCNWAAVGHDTLRSNSL